MIGKRSMSAVSFWTERRALDVDGDLFPDEQDRTPAFVDAAVMPSAAD